jgi:thiamine-monophosphate kinase
VSLTDEFGLIRRLTSGGQAFLQQQQASGGVKVGIGDDAAVVEVNAGTEWVLTCDTMTEEIHFKAITMRDEDIGYKAMASAVSDVAAMGGTPRFAMISITVPKIWSAERLERVYQGLYACAHRWNVAVVGGDTTSSAGGLTISVSVIGEVEAGRALLRSGAKPGDAVFVTGPLGGSAAGLDFLLRQELPSADWTEQEEGVARLVQAHCRPDPQVEAGRLLQLSGLCHSLNDVSDGLASEAWELAEASDVGIDLIEERIRITDELYRYANEVKKDPLDYILYGGEDYQLLGTADAARITELQLRFREAGLVLDVIGYVTPAPAGVRLVRDDGTVARIEKKGYNHFSSSRG